MGGRGRGIDWITRRGERNQNEITKAINQTPHNNYSLLPLSVDNGVNDGDDDDADERGRKGKIESERGRALQVLGKFNFNLQFEK